MGGAKHQRLYPFMPDKPSGIDEAGPDIFWLEPRVTLENYLRRVSSREHSQHMFHGQPSTTDQRFPSEYGRVYRDSFEELFFVHGAFLSFKYTIGTAVYP